MTADLLPRIDAHQHFWTLARGDYAWITPELPAIYRDFGPRDLQPLMQAHGVVGSVLVQAAPTLAETHFMLDLASRHAFIRGVVGWLDLSADDASAVLDEFSDHPAFKAVRPMLQDLPDPAWIATAPIDDAVRHVQRLGLVFDALVRPVHLPHLLAFARRHESLPIVIDHAAKPLLKAPGAAAGFAPWREAMRELARLPQVCCKLSGLLTEAEPGAGADDLRPPVETVLELFGPRRVLWGSDWPVLELASSYAGWVRTSDTLLAGLDGADRRAVLAGNATRFYRLGQDDAR